MEGRDHVQGFQESWRSSLEAALGFPDPSLSPSSLAFGNQAVGVASAPQVVTLTNAAPPSLNITSLTITGANSGDFSETTTCGARVAAGATCTISVVFTPSATGSRSASVSITDNALGSPQTVALSGTGTQSGVSLSPGDLNFDNQNVNTTSAPQTVTLTNTGSTTLTLTAISIAGGDAGDFAETNTCGALPAQLAVGSSCTFSVTFTPLATGSRSASLRITDNAPGSPQTVPLSGTGIQPSVTLSPASLTFPVQRLKTSSKVMAVTVSNTGTGTLNVASISVSGADSADFSKTNTCSSPVAPGGTCTISVTFTPKGINSRTASILIADNAPGSPQTVPLKGTGTEVKLSPASLDFGSVKVGTSSSPRTVTLTDTGTSSLSITGISITGTDSADYSETNTCATGIGAGKSCTITVIFMPKVIGTRTASVSVSDNGGGSPRIVALSGPGM